MYSTKTSPIKPDAAPDSGSFCERSPLKDQNYGDASCENEKSPDLNKSASRIRKRLNPFAVKEADKKYCAKFPVPEDEKKTSSRGTFSWGEKIDARVTYDFASQTSGIAKEFKQPRKLLVTEPENDENEMDDRDDKLTPEQASIIIFDS